MTQINLEKTIFRFNTAGSVDNGKSTLIGRLLFDTGNLKDDQIQALIRSNGINGEDEIDLSRVTDGLKDEQAQGITIDVAYRPFETAKRKFILADTPGHLQYTRNMVTGTSLSEATLILIDATKGVTEQNRRHTYLANLLGIKQIIVAINKMDLVNYSQEIFENIKASFLEDLTKQKIATSSFIPISALNGDNVVKKSDKMPWYTGETILKTLEDAEASMEKLNFLRVIVQRIEKLNRHRRQEIVGYLGSGKISVGQEVSIHPQNKITRVGAIFSDKNVTSIEAPANIRLALRGDIQLNGNETISNLPTETTNLSADGFFELKPNSIPVQFKIPITKIIWFDAKPLILDNKEYWLKKGQNIFKVKFWHILHKIDFKTMEYRESNYLKQNDIADIGISSVDDLRIDDYYHNRLTGNFIIIDPESKNTVAAGIFKHHHNLNLKSL